MDKKIHILNDLLPEKGYRILQGTTALAVKGISFDSRNIKTGDVFVAVSGTKTNGHAHIAEAVEKGAIAIVCEVPPKKLSRDICLIQTEDSARILGIMASAFYGRPSNQLKLIGITGTNGKTTTASLLHESFSLMGIKAGLLSTIENRIGMQSSPSRLTTPDPISLNNLLAGMVKENCSYAFMEVSSHAMVQRRTAGLHFSGGIFTNLSHDHLDYHGSFSEYLKAKKSFFDGLSPDAFALVNADDKNARVMLQNCRARHYSYSMQRMADFKGRLLESGFEGINMEINGRAFWSRLPGGFNAWNLLAVYGASSLLGLHTDDLLRAMSLCRPVSGRFELIEGPMGIKAIADYAHTPDALEKILMTINSLRLKSSRIICVLGCGGDRDREKRPIMASIAGRLADQLILTSDNPRSEDPVKIIEEMKTGLGAQGLRKSLSITRRDEAIAAAVAMADRGDIILVAGKGHETYQEIKGERIHFDDRELLRKHLSDKAEK